MTLVGAGALVSRAVERCGAVAAFNVITLEHAEAVIRGIEMAARPTILQISENAIRFHDGHMRPLLLACRALAERSTQPVALHLDHVQDRALVDEVVSYPELGVGSLMFDGAHLPFDDNVAHTRAVAEQAQAVGIWVEAELGEIGGKDGAHDPRARTDPGEAARFADATAIDALAVAVGSSHAMHDRSATLDTELISRIHEAVAVPLVLHGSSGVSDAQVTAAVRSGIRKVNVGTALNIRFTHEVRRYLSAHRDTSDPRAYVAPARSGVSSLVSELATTISGSAVSA